MDSEKASRPQLAALPGGTTVLAWEELLPVEGKYIQQVGLRFVFSDQEKEAEKFYLNHMPNAHHPVVMALDAQHVLMACTMGTGKQEGVYYLRINSRNTEDFAARKAAAGNAPGMFMKEAPAHNHH